MRRLGPVIAGGLLFLAFVAPVSAVKPDRELVPTTPLFLPAGAVCEFDVTLTAPGQNQHAWTFYDQEGNVRAMTGAGRAPLLVHNDTDDLEFYINAGGWISFGGDEDTFVLEGSGITGLYFFPGDANPAGTDAGGLFALFGSFHEEIDLNTNVVTVFEYSGRYIDLCAAVTPD